MHMLGGVWIHNCTKPTLWGLSLISLLFLVLFHGCAAAEEDPTYSLSFSSRVLNIEGQHFDFPETSLPATNNPIMLSEINKGDAFLAYQKGGLYHLKKKYLNPPKEIETSSEIPTQDLFQKLPFDEPINAMLPFSEGIVVRVENKIHYMEYDSALDLFQSRELDFSSDIIEIASGPSGSVWISTPDSLILIEKKGEEVEALSTLQFPSFQGCIKMRGSLSTFSLVAQCNNYPGALFLTLKENKSLSPLEFENWNATHLYHLEAEGLFGLIDNTLYLKLPQSNLLKKMYLEDESNSLNIKAFSTYATGKNALLNEETKGLMKLSMGKLFSIELKGYKNVVIKGILEGKNSNMWLQTPTSLIYLSYEDGLTHFEEDIYPLAQKHCMRCHPSKQSLDLGSYDGWEKKIDKILSLVSKGKMPKDDVPLNEKEIEIIKKWKEDGFMP